MGILCAHLSKVRKWDGHARGTADFHHSRAAESSERGTGVGGRARGSGTQAYKALGPAGVLILWAKRIFIAPFFGSFKSSQVKSSVLSIALNSVISVTNQTGILSGVTTGTLKPLSEVESALSRAYLISA